MYHYQNHYLSTGKRKFQTLWTYIVSSQRNVPHTGCVSFRMSSELTHSCSQQWSMHMTSADLQISKKIYKCLVYPIGWTFSNALFSSTLHFLGCVLTLQPNPGNGIDGGIFCLLTKTFAKLMMNQTFHEASKQAEELVPETRFTENGIGT